MAVAASDLIAPVGELEPSLFPSDDLTSLLVRLSRYLSDATDRLVSYSTVALPDQQADRARRAYAYAEAYAAVYRRMAAAPISTTFADQGSMTFAVAQAREFKALSDLKRAEYQSLLPVADPATSDEFYSRSGAVPTRISW
ncbi:MAG: hypothetical protein ACR2KM_04170 [Gemmatimonadaceae bacterium]